MATIKDVSISAGVSSATVSHVINNTRYVSDEVRERILNSIRELDYPVSYTHLWGESCWHCYRVYPGPSISSI